MESSSKDEVYDTGDTIDLFCKVNERGPEAPFENSKWKNCQWIRETDDRMCKFTWNCEGMTHGASGMYRNATYVFAPSNIIFKVIICFEGKETVVE